MNRAAIINTAEHWAYKIGLGLLCAIPALLAIYRQGAEIAVCVIGALFVLRSLARWEWHWAKQPEFIALALLWLLMMATAPLAENSDNAFQTGLIWGRMVVFFMAVTCWLLTAPQAITLATRAALATALLLMADAAWQYRTGISLSGVATIEGQRLTGPMSHPNIGNLLLKISLPALGVWFYLAWQPYNRARIYSGFAFALALLAIIIVSGERAMTLLGLLAMMVICGAVAWGWQQMRSRALLAAGMMAALSGVLMVSQPVIRQRIIGLMDKFTDFWQSDYGQLYHAAIYLWQTNPILGIGAGQFRFRCPGIMDKIGIHTCNLHPHQTYLEWLTSTGIIGFIFYVAAVALIAKRVISQLRFSGSQSLLCGFCLAGITALLFPVMSSQSVFINWPGILFWYSLAVSASLPRMLRIQGE